MGEFAYWGIADFSVKLPFRPGFVDDGGTPLRGVCNPSPLFHAVPFNSEHPAG